MKILKYLFPILPIISFYLWIYVLEGFMDWSFDWKTPEWFNSGTYIMGVLLFSGLILGLNLFVGYLIYGKKK